jgi:hypothetical protein
VRVRVGAADGLLTSSWGWRRSLSWLSGWTWSAGWARRSGRSRFEPGHGARWCWSGWRRRNWPGEDFLVGLGRQRADAAGQALWPVDRRATAINFARNTALGGPATPARGATRNEQTQRRRGARLDCWLGAQDSLVRADSHSRTLLSRFAPLECEAVLSSL